MEKIFVVSIMLAGLTPAAFGEVSIQNDQQYIGDDGSLHVVGEIVNDLQAPLNQISIHVTGFDGQGDLILTRETGSLANTVMPGMRAPFDLVLTDRQAMDIRSYSLELDYKISHPKDQGIDITESELSRDGHNNMMITGTLTNNGHITANTVAVIATLYDNEGNVAAASKAHPEPDYLKAKDSVFFLVTVPDKIQTEGVDDFALIAESEEYAAVPEFPIGTLVLLAGALSAYVGIARYSRVTAGLISAAGQR